MVNITPDMLSPITDAVTSNIPVIATVGMTVVAAGVGIRFVVSAVKKFF